MREQVFGWWDLVGETVEGVVRISARRSLVLLTNNKFLYYHKKQNTHPYNWGNYPDNINLNLMGEDELQSKKRLQQDLREIANQQSEGMKALYQMGITLDSVYIKPTKDEEAWIRGEITAEELYNRMHRKEDNTKGGSGIPSP